MTTIAFDGITLAADGCSWSGGIRRRVKKVARVTAPDGRRFLIGFCGEGTFAIATRNWMTGKGAQPNCRDFNVDPTNQFAVVIDEQRRIWELSANFTYSRFYERKMAYGAGQEMAWGALEAGATARRAIEIAMKRSDYAGLAVDCVRF